MLKTYKYLYFITIPFFCYIQLFSQEIGSDNQLRLAKLFEASGKLAEAGEIYQELHLKQPKSFPYYMALNKNLIAQKKYEQALKLVQNQIELMKENVTLLGDLGSIYFLLGEETKAIEVWEKAVGLDPNNAFAYRTIADYLIDYRLIDTAIEFLNRGNEVSDDNTIFSYDVANYYSITMKFEEAAKEYCKILKSKPKQLNLIKSRILLYINTDQATEPTLKTIEDVYDNEEQIYYLQLLAELYSNVNNHQKALEAYITLEKKTTNNGSSLFDFAQKSAISGNHTIASKAYKQVLDNYPSSALFSDAEIGYTRALEEEFNNKKNITNDWKPFVVDEQFDKNEYMKLIESYKLLSKKYFNNKIGTEAQFRIAKLYSYNFNNLDKADSIFRIISNMPKSDPNVLMAEYELAKILIKRDNLDEAIERLNNIIKNKYSTPNFKQNAQFLYAKTLLWKGEFSNSIIAFNNSIENLKELNVNDALQYSLILNTFKNDSTNLFSFANADYLVEKNNFVEALKEFNKLSINDNLFLLKDFAAIRYAELQLALNNYQEAAIFLEEKSNCDKDNIFKDRFLYLLGSNYYFGLKDSEKSLKTLTKIFDEFPNSIYYNKARKIISEINLEVNSSI